MDAETILLAKKFSGSADVSAAKGYMEAAQAAAVQAASSAANIPNNLSSTLTTMANDIDALEAQVANIETSGVNVSGNIGDVVRIGQNGALVAGDRPVTQLMEVTVPSDPANENSGITWIANDNDEVVGFVITDDRYGNSIDGYEHKTYMLGVTNPSNTITKSGETSKTVVLDIDYVNGSSADKGNRGNMYYMIPYEDTHQIAVVIGINAAGCAYTDLDYGSSRTQYQEFPAGTIVHMGKRYQKNFSSGHVEAISFISPNDPLRQGTRIRLWKA